MFIRQIQLEQSTFESRVRFKLPVLEDTVYAEKPLHIALLSFADEGSPISLLDSLLFYWWTSQGHINKTK